MKNSVVFVACLSVTAFNAQVSAEYRRHIQIADSLYYAKDYRNSAENYSKAFKAIGWRGYPDDRYNAACSWALSGVPDSAFFNLAVIINKSGYKNYNHITTDADFKSLYADNRWQPLIDKVKANKEKAEENLDKVLVRQLDSIYVDDQAGRRELDEIQKKHGWNSPEMKEAWKVINRKDSINLIKVKKILDTRGWLGPDMIGEEGSSTLFLVIQHADHATQVKYLPMMREAVKLNKAQPGNLALLEDRVAIGENRRQIYGSQIGTHSDGKHFLFPLEDPDRVDERRSSVGLGTLAEYLAHWNIKWDVEQYKKELPELEEMLKKGKK